MGGLYAKNGRGKLIDRMKALALNSIEKWFERRQELKEGLIYFMEDTSYQNS